MMTNVMVKKCLNRKITKNSNLIQAKKNSVCPRAKVIRRPIFPESRIFRIVDSTHDMIIVKWHLLNFSKPNLSEYLPNVPKCGLNTRHNNREVTWSDVKWREMTLLIMTNVMVKTCLNQKIIKNSNLIQAFKNSVCPKAKVIRRPNFSESRFSPNIYRMFRSVDWTHGMVIVKWHLFIWHERKICALTIALAVQSTQTGQWPSTLFHANCSVAQVYVLYPRQFIFAPSCRLHCAVGVDKPFVVQLKIRLIP